MVFEKIVEFIPAYDKTNPDPSKNYGIGSVNIRFVFKGDKGAVQFVIGTNWHLPHIQRQFFDKPFPYFQLQPMAYDLGYHSDKPIRDYQSDVPRKDENGEDEFTTPSRECPYTKSGRCFYDGSTLNAEPIVEVLLSEGHEGVWRELEKYYKDIFGE